MALDILIKRIRSAIVDGGDFDSLLAEMVEEHGVSAIKPLLLMMDFNDDQIQEMYSVTHAVESFPQNHYMAQLADAIEEMQSVSPNYLRFVVGRIMNSDECVEVFVSSVRRLPPQCKKCVVAVLGEVRAKYSGKEVIFRNCSLAISALSN